MGKVFERHPKLRFGIAECGSTWLGPCVERMDLWSDFMNKVGVKYAMKPSRSSVASGRMLNSGSLALPKPI
jgi:hypothetical protein